MRRGVRVFWKSMAVWLGFVLGQGALWAQVVAERPPMGWNSWDSYGLSVTDAEWKANATVLHEVLEPFGWQYAVLDEGWYLEHPERAGGTGDQGYTLDEHGQYIAAAARFPGGVAGLAAFAHGLGLRFGLHIIRGIPKLAVERGAVIAGTTQKAGEAADTADLCRWNPDNYGVKDNAAGQAYYDGLMQLYAGWGVDLLKVDCISAPYVEHEIHMIRRAIEKTGRPIVLSLSPGPTPLERAPDVRHEAQLWRISNDVWDVWGGGTGKLDQFPQPVRSQFEQLARWAPLQEPGHWPDADMLPFGQLGPRPGWEKARASRLSLDEERTVLSLWAIARSPLILGANLTQLSPELRRVLTNREVLAVDQEGQRPRQVLAEGSTVIWRSEAPDGGSYVGVFNVGETPSTVRMAWSRVLPGGGTQKVRDLWLGEDRGAAKELAASLPAHGAALLRVSASQ